MELEIQKLAQEIERQRLEIDKCATSGKITGTGSEHQSIPYLDHYPCALTVDSAW